MSARERILQRLKSSARKQLAKWTPEPSIKAESGLFIKQISWACRHLSENIQFPDLISVWIRSGENPLMVFNRFNRSPAIPGIESIRPCV